MKLLTQALDHHANTRGHQLALRFLETGDVDGLKCELTYAEFREQAQKIAWNLQQKVEPGERVLLLYDGGMEFVLGFYGCLYAGIIAVPTYPPDPGRIHRTLPRLQAISQDAGAVAVLTTQKILDAAEPLCAEVEGLAKLHWLASDNGAEPKTAFKPANLDAKQISYLQYTSGSTGTPKGVMVTRSNLSHTCEDFLERWPYRETTHQVSWLPSFHDLGLIWGILTPLYGGFPCTFMRPVSFLQKPVTMRSSPCYRH